MRLGFDYFDTVPRTSLTTKEILAGMTAQQKVRVLTAFKTRVGVPVAARHVKVSKAVIKHLYGKIREVELMAREYMRGDTPPDTSAELVAIMKDLFVADFTSGEVTAILTAMVKYSKHSGDGNWAYYKSSVIL